MSTTAPRVVTGTAAEQSRARYPDAEGFVERLGGIETGHRELLDWIDQWISR